MPAVQRLGPVESRCLAIAAAEPPIVGIQQTRACAADTRRLRDITDAVRPRVIGIEADAMAETLLQGEKQPVVADRPARFKLIDVAEELAFPRVPQVSKSALIRIRCRVAGWGYASRASERAWHEHCRVELFAHPEVRGFAAHVRCRNQPATSNLPLKTEVPRINRRGLGVRLLRDEGAELHERRVGVKAAWEWVPSRDSGKGIGEIERARRLNRVPKRWCCGGCGHDHEVRKIIRHAERSSD